MQGIKRDGRVRLTSFALAWLVVVWGFLGSSAAQTGVPFITSGLNAPYGIVIDSSGNFLVANSNDGTVGKYSSTGTLINGSFITGLSSPTGLAIDTTGNIYVANSGQNEISKYSSTGTLITATYITGLNDASDIIFDSSGMWWVTTQ